MTKKIIASQDTASSNLAKQVFLPSTPVSKKDQCYGRLSEINQIARTLREAGKHVLLFGGRGYGKTSVANIAANQLSDFFIVKMNCYRAMNNFTSVWKEIFELILSSFQQAGNHLKLKKKIENYFPIHDVMIKENLRLIDIIAFFKNVDFPLLIILDEADLIAKNQKILSMFADLIKTLSDQLPQIKLLIIGIAENSRDFIGEHASLERCLVEIKLSKMGDQELMDLLEGGLFKIGLQASEDIKNNIVIFSNGLPFYVHLLSLYAVEDAESLGYKALVEKNFQNAVLRALRNVEENLKKLLEKVIGKSSETYLTILNAAMVSEETKLAEEFYLKRQNPKYQIDFDQISFTAAMINDHLENKYRISQTEKKIYRILTLFSGKPKGPILSRYKNPQHTTYCFINPLFRAFLRHRLYLKTELTKPVFFIS